MPYRRLPNTDQARLKALQMAVTRASEDDYTQQVIKYQTFQEAQHFVLQFKGHVTQYQDNFTNRVTVNKQYHKMVQNARMYISHFIQVLNLAVIRGEIKKEQKEFYGLDTENHIVPPLLTDEDLLVWGQRIIDGEQKRISMGGFPIYNPAINKVRVYYDIFKEHQFNHMQQIKSESRSIENLGPMREKADRIILEIWNQVEGHFQNLLPYARMMACKDYGVIYYYRTGEKHLTPETDQRIKASQEAQCKLDF